MSLKRIFLFIAMVCIVFIKTNAQQWVEFSQQNQYNLFLNPANAGANSMLNATLAHRSQYTFLSKQAIASQYAAFSMPIFAKNYGVGLRIVNDFIGYQRYTTVDVNGAYHLQLKKSTLSFGLGVGIANLSINGRLLRASDGQYDNELVIHNDAHLPNENVGSIAPSFSFGLHYNINAFSIGAAIQNLNSPKFKLLKNNAETNVFLNRTININTSYVIVINKVKLTPTLNYNTDFVKHQFLVEIVTELNNIYFGLAFRGYSGYNNDALIGSVGMKIKEKIKIAYAYDYNVSFLNKANYGSHELSINYTLPQKFATKNKGNVLFNPRFL